VARVGIGGAASHFEDVLRGFRGAIEGCGVDVDGVEALLGRSWLCQGWRRAARAEGGKA
jgi:hypothetical protein